MQLACAPGSRAHILEARYRPLQTLLLAAECLLRHQEDSHRTSPHCLSSGLTRGGRSPEQTDHGQAAGQASAASST
eukprot:1360231-Heterocapsa_arctica.AAC.1